MDFHYNILMRLFIRVKDIEREPYIIRFQLLIFFSLQKYGIVRVIRIKTTSNCSSRGDLKKKKKIPFHTFYHLIQNFYSETKWIIVMITTKKQISRKSSDNST